MSDKLNLDGIVDSTRIQEIKKEYLKCTACDREVEKGKEYVSPYKFPYCDIDCYINFLQD